MKKLIKFLGLILVFVFLADSQVPATSVNAAALRQMQMQNYQQTRYNAYNTQKQIPYWKMQSNYNTRNKYNNYIDYSRQSQYNQYYRGK